MEVVHFVQYKTPLAERKKRKRKEKNNRIFNRLYFFFFRGSPCHGVAEGVKNRPKATVSILTFAFCVFNF
jgi:hypothetical protein